jgi:uncharacterized protein YbjT (DUF2867 family)
MVERVAVVGSTGRLGRHVVASVREAGHEVVGLSRSGGSDVLDLDGLTRDLAGATVVVDAASGRAPDQAAAEAFFTAAATNLQEAARRVGARRVITVSIVGNDRFRLGYNAATYAHERASLAGDVPVRVLRATQFHELVPQLAEWGRVGDVVYVPGMRTQLVAARAAAERLVEVALAPGAELDGAVVEVGGPREERLADAVRQWLGAGGTGVQVVEVEDPTDPDQLYESGALLPGPGAALVGPTFGEWLAGLQDDPVELAHVRGRLDSART